MQASKWCIRGVDLLAAQGIDQCSTEAGARLALEEIDLFLQQMSHLTLDDAQQFHEQSSQWLDSNAIVRLYFTIICNASLYSIVRQSSKMRSPHTGQYRRSSVGRSQACVVSSVCPVYFRSLATLRVPFTALASGHSFSPTNTGQYS